MHVDSTTHRGPSLRAIATLALGLLSLAGLSACSDDDTSNSNNQVDASVEDAQTKQDGDITDSRPRSDALPDGDIDGSVGCDPGDRTQTPHHRAMITTSSYGNGGGLSVVTLDPLAASADVAQVPEDAVTRWFDHKLWVLGRYNADNLTILDGQNFSLVTQFSVGVGTNPQDIACTSTCRCYVSKFDAAKMTIVDPTAQPGTEIVGSIDLAGLADNDGLPEMSYLYLDGAQLIVAIERLNHNDPNMAPSGDGALAVIDTTTDTIVDADPNQSGVQAITLPYQNPVSPILAVTGAHKVAVACAASWQAEDCGGIAVVDLDAMTAESAVTCSDLGGVVTDFTLDGQGCGFAVVMNPQTYATSVKHFCLDGSNIDSCITEGTFDQITDAALTSEGDLLVTDGSYSTPGIRVFHPGDCSEITTDVLATGFAPGFADPILLVP